MARTVDGHYSYGVAVSSESQALLRAVADMAPYAQAAMVADLAEQIHDAMRGAR